MAQVGGPIIGAILGGAKGALAGILIGGGVVVVATPGRTSALPRQAGYRFATFFMALRAAPTVLRTSLTVWARERNQASNWDGGP
jgi:hypothetical protein